MRIDDQHVQKHQLGPDLQPEDDDKNEDEEPEEELYEEEQEEIENESLTSTSLPPLLRESVNESQSNMVWQLVGNVSGPAVSFRGKRITPFHT